jgi:ATP-dependent DNA ligase
VRLPRPDALRRVPSCAPPPPAQIHHMEWRTKPPAKRPGNIEPCIPTRAAKPPVGPQWIHEIKHDGYRLIARKRDGRVRLFTRNGFDWTDRYPRISEALAALQPASATIDGEAVWCDGEGFAIFDKLRSRGHDGAMPSTCSKTVR